jgi:hypothetical protein
MRNWIRSVRCAVIAVGGATLAAMLVGCGGSDTPELATVSGQVTLDGQPLPDARVQFQPTGEGRLTIATTDANGQYELLYTEGVPGTVAGKYLVRINTGQQASDVREGATPAIPEKVPVQYNRDARDTPEMNVEVKPGSNEINFPLKSGGDIVQPPSDG